VNVFAGIVNCATIARGIVAAAGKMGMPVPMVVRLEGTNVEEARRILADSRLRITMVADLDEAAKAAVACAT
jgi:succinyl-CoA synthetase beta subunit